MAHFKKYFILATAIMGSDGFILKSGFFFGSTYYLNKKNVVNNPFQTIILSAFCGFLGMGGLALVSILLPPPVKFLAPTILGTSWGYHHMYGFVDKPENNMIKIEFTKNE